MVSKETFLKALKQGGEKAAAKQDTHAEKAVPFLRNDFAMSAPKHWDEEEELEEETF